MGWERGSTLTAPPFGYSPELPRCRPGGPKTRPANSLGHLPSRLPAGISRSLRRLRGLHLRLSLCRVSIATGCDSRLAQIDDGSLIAELADDGSMIVIFIHPQGIDDEAATGGLAARLEHALRQLSVPLGALKIAVLHCDASAIDDGNTTLHALTGQPPRPLLAAAAFAVAAVPAAAVSAKVPA
jgi:hypothetical protein